MKNNPLLGQLLSEHPSDGTRLGAIKRLTGGCIMLLLLPMLGAACGIITAFTDSARAANDRESIYFYIGGLVITSILIALLFVMIYRLPKWLEQRERVEIYENGFVVKRPMSSPISCLWQEIQTVDPKTPGDYIPKAGEEIVFYAIHKKDGGKISVGRGYSDIERLDEILLPFWRAVPTQENPGEIKK